MSTPTSHGPAEADLPDLPDEHERLPDVPGPSRGLGAWLNQGASDHDEGHGHAHARPWWQVLWLTGVDYFSTLGYQPGIALLAAGALSPIATLILVLVTLFGALPIYRQVAARSYIGQGSIAMLEALLSGWRGKLFVLALLGFAATDFVITMTLSAADAALHIEENPLVAHHLKGWEIPLTLGLLTLLAAVFLKGFREAIGVALFVGIPYIVLNLVVVIRGFIEIVHQPEALPNWTRALSMEGSFTGVVLLAAMVFPRLALGLSGFETGVAVMPLVKGDPEDEGRPRPEGRIRATGKLLTAAAVLMSVMLLCTSFVTTLLIPKEAYQKHGPAAGRALAYLAHHYLGGAFGTLYDLSTILILWFAGASAMAGLLNLVPRYLPRLGMAPRWVAHPRPLVLVLFGIDVLVTLIFRADVEAQAGAYATGVLALILSAAVAVTMALWRENRDVGRNGLSPAVLYFGAIALVFAYTFAQNIHERHDGLVIASIFILCIVVLSALSRLSRATELRVERITLADHQSAALWTGIRGKRISLVPLKYCTTEGVKKKAEEIRQHYRVNGVPLAFLHVWLRDDRSDFSSVLRVKVEPVGQDYLIEVTGAVAIANTIAYISELLDPVSIFLGLTRQNSVSQAFRYLLWGEGETGIRVYEILLRHWRRTPEEDVRPFIYLMSEGGE